MTVRVLFLADSHLGFDHPVSPRVYRRRRGHDFLANHERALQPALDGEVDLVVHGGDVFHMPQVPPSLVYQAFRPLHRVAEAGVPVYVVPGNHERGRIPHRRLAAHPGVHVFDAPRTFVAEVRGVRVALSGFPYAKRVRDAFPGLWAAAGGADAEAHIRLLCMHHCVEGAKVGPSDHTFRRAPDVVQGQDLPAGVAAVLSGHIHRQQRLTHDLAGRSFPAPVLYPGSVERTAFAEMEEEKGYLTLELETGEAGSGGRLAAWRFEPLPARPMEIREIHGSGASAESLWAAVVAAVGRASDEAVLRIRVRGHVPPAARVHVTAGRLRALAPRMNVEVVFDTDGGRTRAVRPTRVPARSPALALPLQ